MDTDTTNPVGADDTSTDTVTDDTEVDLQASEPEPQYDDAGNLIEEPAEDEEVELDDDLKLKVSKDQAQKVKDGFLRQADYTRKTQALSAERQAVQAERQVLQQATQAEVETLAQVTAINQQLAQYDNIDWDAWHDADPFEAAKAEGRYHRLIQTRNMAAGHLGQLQQQRFSIAKQETDKRVEQARVALQADKDIGGWTDQKAAEVLTGGIREYGFDRSEIEELSDARMVKVLHDGLKWRAHQESQRAANKNLQAQTAQPAAKVGATTPPPGKLDDRLGTEEWVRRRNAQVRKRA